MMTLTADISRPFSFSAGRCISWPEENSMTALKTMPLAFAGMPEREMLARARDFRSLMDRRRTVRDFSERPVPRELVEHAVMTAATAPSGAHQQPWTFVCVGDAATKQRIRAAAEAEERAFYEGGAPAEWLEALEPLGTDANKPFLEIAPWLVVVFAQRYGVKPDGSRRKHYYVPESVGIATGMLIASLHNAGLATLTHTPSPMGFLNEICGRPENEKAVILLVAGYPADDAQVPDIRRKEAGDLIVWKE
jgi:nitroreductase